MATPGFLENGIDFEQLVKYYLANNCYIEITNPKEVELAIELMKHVIGTSFGYKKDFASTIHGRFQMIFNSTLEESHVQTAGLIKRSNAVWLLTGTYEAGTDFQSNNGKQIEAKVYKNFNNMKDYAKKGSEDYTVFHGADYVLCYLIDRPELSESLELEELKRSKHWYWLKKINGIYTVYNNVDLNNVTDTCLLTTIPVCQCTLRDNKLVLSKKFCYI